MIIAPDTSPTPTMLRALRLMAESPEPTKASYLWLKGIPRMTLFALRRRGLATATPLPTGGAWIPTPRGLEAIREIEPPNVGSASVDR